MPYVTEANITDIVLDPGTGRAVLEDVGLAGGVGGVGSGRVRCERREHDRAPGRHRCRDRAGRVVEALPPDRLDPPVAQRAEPVDAGHDPRAAVVDGGVGEAVAHGQSGLAGADDEGVGGGHGTGLLEVRARGSPAGAIAGTYVSVNAQASYSPLLPYPFLPSSLTLSAQSIVRIN